MYKIRLESFDMTSSWYGDLPWNETISAKEYYTGYTRAEVDYNRVVELAAAALSRALSNEDDPAISIWPFTSIRLRSLAAHYVRFFNGWKDFIFVVEGLEIGSVFTSDDGARIVELLYEQARIYSARSEKVVKIEAHHVSIVPLSH